MVGRWAIVGLLVIGLSKPIGAKACMGVYAQTLVIHDVPPQKLPPLTILLKVDPGNQALGNNSANGQNTIGVEVIASSVPSLVGHDIELSSPIFTTCSAWGRKGAIGYVVGFPAMYNGKIHIKVVSYRLPDFRTDAENQSQGIEPPADYSFPDLSRP